MVVKKILVAIDRSPQASVIFEQALELAQKQESHLMVFHSINWNPERQASPFVGIVTVGDVGMYGAMQQLRQERFQEELQNVRTWLQSYCQYAASKNVPTEFQCHSGDPGSQICNLARNWEADLIIIGRRGYKGLSEILLGSVSNYVVHHAPCSVLVMQGVTTSTTDSTVTTTELNRNG